MESGTEEKYTRHGADRRAFAAVCGAKYYRDAGRLPLYNIVDQFLSEEAWESWGMQRRTWRFR